MTKVHVLPMMVLDLKLTELSSPRLSTGIAVLCVSSTKSHASGKIKNRYFRILRMGSDVFFDADSESPHMT